MTPPTPPVATQPDGPVDANGIRLTLPDLDSTEWQDVGDGLRIWDTVVGDGEVVGPIDTSRSITVVGSVTPGEEFDASLDAGQPLTSSLAGGLIEGFTRLIPGMQPGGIRRLDIPSEFAYGERGQGASIPPNADLVFEVQLISSTSPTTTNSGTNNFPIPTSGNTGEGAVPTNGSSGPFPGTGNPIDPTQPSSGSTGTDPSGSQSIS